MTQINLQPGQLLTHTFAVIKSTKKTAKNGEFYTSLSLISPDLQMTGTLWDARYQGIPIRENEAYEVTGTINVFMGKPSLQLTSAKSSSTPISAFLPDLPTVVFDIETLGQQYADLSESQKQYLAHLYPDLPVSELGDKTALHPLFGNVIYVAMHNPSSGKGVVFGVSGGEIKPVDPQFSYTTCKDEKELLTNVWATIAKYQQYVSYNGKGFDYPFLLFRSLVHKVTIAKGLESTRHLDLAKLLRPNNSQYKLSAICEALGIDDPKSHGVSGLYVSQLYRQHKYQEIVDYVARDVISTTALYQALAHTAPLLLV